MNTNISAFFVFIFVTMSLFAQSGEPIVLEVQHKGYDRLGIEFAENMKALINETAQYKLWTDEPQRFQIFLTSVDPLKSENGAPAGKVCTVGYVFVLYMASEKNPDMQMYLTSGLINFNRDKSVKKAAQRVLYEFHEIISQKRNEDMKR
ncbi:MAG: hypothetical protein ACXAC2_24725 [Candidatus Kariarchaeaceae archaeon]|jgi:hypothetical protein